MIASNMGKVGEAIHNMSMTNVRRELDTWQSELFVMENKLEDLEDESSSIPKKIQRVKRRMTELNEQIHVVKKTCVRIEK